MKSWLNLFWSSARTGTHRIQVGDGPDVVCTSGQTLLAALEAAGQAWPSGCRSGRCGECKTRLLAGRVELQEDHCLSPSELSRGWTLPCVATPRSDIRLEPRSLPAGGLRHPYRVQAANLVTTDVLHLSLVPASGTPGLRSFQPGQHARIESPRAGSRLYSMAAPPRDDGVLEFHVRWVPGGRLSTHLCRDTRAGDLLFVSGPFGAFGWQSSRRPSLLVAGGTGLAPLRAMLLQRVAQQDWRPVTMYWGASRTAGLYGLEAVLGLTAVHPGLAVVPVISEPQAGDTWSGRVGLLHEVVLADFPHLAGHDVYACGSPRMLQAAHRAFTESAGLPPEHFHADAFVAT